MKFNMPINNFASGEWSSKMKARTETDQYQRAAQSLQNCIVQMQGGAFRRPGTAYVDLTATYNAYLDATKIRMLPITLSDTTSHILMANNELAETGTNPWFVHNVGTGANSLVDSQLGTLGTLPQGAEAIYTNIDTSQYVQVGNTLFIADGQHLPRYLTYESSTWKLWSAWMKFTPSVPGASQGPWAAYPFGPIQTLGIAGTITATGASFAAGATVDLVSTTDQFYAAMVSPSASEPGCLFKFTQGGSTGVVMIASVTNATTATAIVVVAIPGASPQGYGTTAGTAWEKALWNGYDGYPRTVTAYQGRVIYGGNANFPDYVWGSRIGNPFYMMEVPFAQDADFADFADDNARPFTMQPSAANGSNITGLSAAKTLVIHTQRNEIVGYGTNGAFGPNDFTFESSTAYGAAYVQPVRTNNFLTFVQRGARTIRDIIFNFDEAQYKSADLGFVADHLVPSGDYIVEMTGGEIGSSVLFARTFEGRLNVVTLDRDYQVNAWAPFIFGGSYSGLYGTTPECAGVCVVPNVSTGKDVVFFLIRRTINGSTQVYLEKMKDFYEDSPIVMADVSTSTGAGLPFYVDCCEFINQVSSTTVAGLTHLVGQSVSVLADGLYIGEKTVSGAGEITLTTAATKILAGLQYTNIIRPMPIEHGGQTGSPAGRDKRVEELFIRLYNSKGAKYGIPDGTMYDVTMTVSTALHLFTGDQIMKFPPGYKQTYSVEVRSTAPFPCNVLGIGMSGVTYD